MACDTPIPPKTKGYTTKRRYQQTRRDKQKTPQIMNDQLDNIDVGKFTTINATHCQILLL
jgi:hypothetical protein